VTSLFPTPDVGGVLFGPLSLLKRVLRIGAARRLVHARLVTGDDACETRYIGEGDSLGFLASRHRTRVEHLPPVSILKLGRTIRGLRTEALLYVETNRLLAPLLPNGAKFTVPWIRQRVPFDADPAARGAAAVESVYGRKVRKYGFEHRIVGDPALVREFHDEFYVPYITGRFGDAAHPRSRRALENFVRRGFLLQVLDGERWISGVVCRPGRGRVTAVAYGLRGDPGEMLRRGALSACTYFLLCWARERGLRSVDLLRSRPHVSDGVYEHKRRFGAIAEVDAWPHTGIRVYAPLHRALPDAAAGLLVVGAGGLIPLSEALREA
jgi:hypothetical protein